MEKNHLYIVVFLPTWYHPITDWGAVLDFYLATKKQRQISWIQSIQKAAANSNHSPVTDILRLEDDAATQRWKYKEKESNIWRNQERINLISKQRLLDKEIMKNIKQNHGDIVNLIAEAATQICQNHDMRNRKSNQRKRL